MKKLTLTISGLALLAFATASCSNDKKKFRDEVVKECVEGGDQQFTEPKMRGYFHEYCECSGEKTSDKLSKAEWQEFEKMKKEGRQEEMQAKLMPIIQPCLDELQKKMAASMK